MATTTVSSDVLRPFLSSKRGTVEEEIRTWDDYLATLRKARNIIAR
jgi:hypothetical protein